MRRSLVFFVFIFFCIVGFSQETINGYIITNDNDTVFGEIWGKYNEIKFREPQKGKVEYTANDIKGYALENGKRYMSVKTHSGEGFGIVLVDGYYRLVYIEIFSEPGYIKNSSYNAYTKTAGTYGRELLYSNYKIYKGEKEVFYVSRETFKGRTANFFSDYPELQEQIKSKKLKFGDLKFIVNKYNMWQQKK